MKKKMINGTENFWKFLQAAARDDEGGLVMELLQEEIDALRGIDIQSILEGIDRDFQLSVVEHGRTLSCFNCNHCCKIDVDITSAEADLLVKVIKKNKIELNASSNECPLLGKDGKCQAYNSRPGVCRIANSLDNSDLCDTSIVRDIKRHAHFKSELTVSALMNLYGGTLEMKEALKQARIRANNSNSAKKTKKPKKKKKIRP